MDTRNPHNWRYRNGQYLGHRSTTARRRREMVAADRADSRSRLMARWLRGPTIDEFLDDLAAVGITDPEDVLAFWMEHVVREHPDRAALRT